MTPSAPVTMIRFLSRVATAVSLAAFVTACGSDERVDPVDAAAGSTGTSSSSGGTSTGTSSGGGGEPEPGPAVRSVFVRNPIGSPADNLFADGDFELSIVPEQSAGGQWGWRAFSTTGGEAALLAETGGLCRTGLRCGRLGKRRILFGQGTAAPNLQPHSASLWVKAVDPATVDAEKPCELIGQAVVVHCDNFAVVSSLRPSDAPDKDGWCSYSDDFTGSRDALCLYVELEEREVLLDSATLLPAQNDVAPRSAPLLGADTRARMQTVRATIRARMPLSSDSLPFDAEGRPTDPRKRRGLEP
jgi:hypothetical protein